MPNWCSNYLTISGPRESLKKVRDEFKSPTGPLSFEKHVPLPVEGADGNYSYDVWGTREVHDSDVSLEDHSDNEDDCYLTYSFSTAWTPPRAWLSKVVELFPDLTFSMFYEEVGDDIYGEASGEDGIFADDRMSRDTYLYIQDDTYTELTKEVASFTQEQLIKYFARVDNFIECCCGIKEWDEELNSKYNWDEVDMDGYHTLACRIIPRIESKNLPLFMNVDWGWGTYNQMFKDRLSEGVPNG